MGISILTIFQFSAENQSLAILFFEWIQPIGMHAQMLIVLIFTGEAEFIKLIIFSIDEIQQRYRGVDVANSALKDSSNKLYRVDVR